MGLNLMYVVGISVGSPIYCWTRVACHIEGTTGLLEVATVPSSVETETVHEPTMGDDTPTIADLGSGYYSY